MRAAQSKDKQQHNARDWSWHFWPLVPLYPYNKRRTLRREIIKDTIWTFDQIQGILYTVTPIRMTAIRLSCSAFKLDYWEIEELYSNPLPCSPAPLPPCNLNN